MKKGLLAPRNVFAAGSLASNKGQRAQRQEHAKFENDLVLTDTNTDDGTLTTASQEEERSRQPRDARSHFANARAPVSERQLEARARQKLSSNTTQRYPILSVDKQNESISTAKRSDTWANSGLHTETRVQNHVEGASTTGEVHNHYHYHYAPEDGGYDGSRGRRGGCGNDDAYWRPGRRLYLDPCAYGGYPIAPTCGPTPGYMNDWSASYWWNGPIYEPYTGTCTWGPIRSPPPL